jgi:hypothetical protein
MLAVRFRLPEFDGSSQHLSGRNIEDTPNSDLMKVELRTPGRNRSISYFEVWHTRQLPGLQASSEAMRKRRDVSNYFISW